MYKLLDGKAIAKIIKEEISLEVTEWKNKGISPTLAVILAGDDPASVYYANAKKKVCANLGFEYQLHELSAQTNDRELLELTQQLNNDKNVHGIMVMPPLPRQIDKDKVMASIKPEKDVDGVHPVNRGYIMSGQDGLFPATPQSCIEILLRSGVEIAGKNVVIVGRGDTVGKPLVFMILKHNATVTICHSKTVDLGAHTRKADIIIAAVGRAGIITADMVKEGAVVVDAGINKTENGICGDVDFEGVKEVAGMISPVPGGVGSLTTALLLKNVLKGISLQKGES
ncbi:MAG: tetrahydrofolate dehydrogenase/cyclohydrolase catalytic domain-containing protein [Eubacteriales bacterium]